MKPNNNAKVTKQQIDHVVRMMRMSGDMICKKIKAGNTDIGSAISRYISFADHLKIYKKIRLTKTYLGIAKAIIKHIERNKDKFVGTNIVALKDALIVTVKLIQEQIRR